MEILPSNQFESHSQSANDLKRPFGVQNDKYGTCHGADFYKNDILSRSPNPENDALFIGTSQYGKIYEYPPPGGLEMHLTTNESKKEGSRDLKCMAKVLGTLRGFS